jgi:septum formation topological specificity factor MinE
MFSSHNSSHNSRNNSRPSSRNNSRPPSTEPEPNPDKDYEEMYVYDETSENNKQGFKGILPVTRNELIKLQDTLSRTTESLQLENREQILLAQARILHEQKIRIDSSKQEILEIINKNYLNIMDIVNKSFENAKENNKIYMQTLMDSLPLLISNIMESKLESIFLQNKEKISTGATPDSALDPVPAQNIPPGIIQQNNQQGHRGPPQRRQPEYKKRPAFNGIQCTNCAKIGHMLEKCFFHPDPTIALMNRRERNIMCLLCGNREHTSEHCPTYPGILPVKDRCPQCKLKNIVLYHPNDRCSKN